MTVKGPTTTVAAAGAAGSRRRCSPGLVGRTEDWLSRVENGKIELDRLSAIRRLADALDVSIGDLVAEPTLLDWTTDSGTRTVPALRSVLMDYRQVSPLLAGASGTATPMASHRASMSCSATGSRHEAPDHGARSRHGAASAAPLRTRPLGGAG